MNQTPNVGECAKILKALADESRLKIVRLLLNGEQSVSEVVRLLGMAQPQVSHHLSILRSSGLVDTRREGKKIINFIDTEVKYILEKKEIGLDLGCCSIQFDETPNLPAS
jgi:DNA-binding transcriptional ArsR family regulator